MSLQTLISEVENLVISRKGGTGSGNFGHAGVPGHLGGSSSKGGGSSAGGGLTFQGGGVLEGIENIAGRKFNPEATKTIGNRVSNLMRVSLGSEKPKVMIDKLTNHFESNGMKKVQGRSSNELMFGNSDQSKIATIKKQSTKVGSKTLNSLLVEVIVSK